MRWCIYYGDGSTFSDLDGKPQMAPGLDVQLVAQDDAVVKHEEDVGCVYLYGHFAYWWENGQWFSSDQMGVWDYLQRARGAETKVLFGRSVTSEQFVAITERVRESGLRPKTAWKRGEQWPRPRSGDPL